MRDALFIVVILAVIGIIVSVVAVVADAFIRRRDAKHYDADAEALR